MDLVIVNKQKHVHYILPIIIFFSTIILSYAKIQETALPFLLHLFNENNVLNTNRFLRINSLNITFTLSATV